ncbi:MAG: hypothetical protein HC850_17265 [Rhodomicrobium sp.]|nr:hypothetical protein [Rhodomicrobium sp.]
MRLRRSELSTPGSNAKMLAKAAASAADVVLLDLEDSVAPQEKAAARGTVIAALRTLDWGRKTRAVRINALETHHAHQDIIEVVAGAREHLDLIVIPKVKRARDVWWVDVLLTQLEARLQLGKRIGLGRELEIRVPTRQQIAFPARFDLNVDSVAIKAGRVIDDERAGGPSVLEEADERADEHDADREEHEEEEKTAREDILLVLAPGDEEDRSHAASSAVSPRPTRATKMS